jgi:hypothetical protein
VWVGGHADVDHHRLRRVGPHPGQQLLAVAHLGGNLDGGGLKDPGQALAEQHRVVGDHDPHGSSALIRVPWPAGLSTRRRPSRAATRSARPRRPEPLGSAPPTPSSPISTRRPRSRRRALMVTALARACLAALASPSEAT